MKIRKEEISTNIAEAIDTSEYESFYDWDQDVQKHISEGIMVKINNLGRGNPLDPVDMINATVGSFIWRYYHLSKEKFKSIYK